MSITLSIKDDLMLDERLKAKEIYLFLHLVRLCNEDGIINLSLVELMKETRLTNKRKLIEYIGNLESYEYLERLESLDRKSVFKLNRFTYHK